jgi:hypothetical protein
LKSHARREVFGPVERPTAERGVVQLKGFDTSYHNPIVPLPTATAVPSATQVALSESLLVTFTIEADAPLIVKPPRELLAPESFQLWYFVRVEDSFQKIGDRERWTQVYKLKPYVLNEQLPLEFTSFIIQAGPNAERHELKWEKYQIRITTQIPKELPPPRAVTAEEQLPPLPKPPESASSAVPTFVAVAVVAFAGVWLAWRRWKPKKTPPLTRWQWMNDQISQLDRRPNNMAKAERLTDTIRAYLAKLLGVQTAPRTTTELLAEMPVVAPLQDVLLELDTVKFAGVDAESATWERWLTRIQDWVTEQEQKENRQGP